MIIIWKYQGKCFYDTFQIHTPQCSEQLSRSTHFFPKQTEQLSGDKKQSMFEKFWSILVQTEDCLVLDAASFLVG